VLTLPHSNAEEERVFSMVIKNKTSFRPNLGMAGTLQSILTIKLGNSEQCTKYEPSKEVLATAKKATKEYNRTHCSASASSSATASSSASSTVGSTTTTSLKELHVHIQLYRRRTKSCTST